MGKRERGYTEKGNRGRRMGKREGAPRTREIGGSPFGFYRALLQREYIPYFRRVLGEGSKERPKRSKEKKGKRQGKREYSGAGEEERYTGKQKYRRFFLRGEYIFHLQNDARDRSNHDYGNKQQREIGISRWDDGRGSRGYFRNTL